MELDELNLKRCLVLNIRNCSYKWDKVSYKNVGDRLRIFEKEGIGTIYIEHGTGGNIQEGINQEINERNLWWRYRAY